MIERRQAAESPFWSSLTLLEITGAAVALCVMGVYAFTVMAPYFFTAATQAANVLEIIKSNQSTVNIITTAVVMFYFGASVGRRKDQDALKTLADTNAKQVDALAPVPGAKNATADVVIPPGGTATVAASTEGEIAP